MKGEYYTDIVEILNVSLSEVNSEQLWGRHIDLPKPGSKANSDKIDVMGWVLGQNYLAVAVELVHEGTVVQRVPINARRLDVADAFPDVSGAKNSGFRTTVSVLESTPELELKVQAVLEDESRVSVGVIRARRRWHETGTFSIKEELKNLILGALEAKYVSESRDGRRTGNHYQSVTLGNMQTTGFRRDRREFLDQIDFEGKKVLDLGSNLGEISRAARIRGAYLVDGFEYEQYFLEVADLVNAYNGITRVSFYQRDITDPSVYDERYDIVLAFSVFTDVHPVLEQIAAITNQLFVLETHKLEGNLDSGYLKPVSQHFPHYRILGESEWSARGDASERRAIIVFAKEESTLAATLTVPSI